MLPDVGQLAVSQAQKYKLCHKKQIEEKARPGREWKPLQNHVVWFNEKFNVGYKYYNSICETCWTVSIYT